MQVYLWYVYYSKLFSWVKREENFGNSVTEIVRKSKRGKKNDVTEERREK